MLLDPCHVLPSAAWTRMFHVPGGRTAEDHAPSRKVQRSTGSPYHSRERNGIPELSVSDRVAELASPANSGTRTVIAVAWGRTTGTGPPGASPERQHSGAGGVQHHVPAAAGHAGKAHAAVLTGCVAAAVHRAAGRVQHRRPDRFRDGAGRETDFQGQAFRRIQVDPDVVRPGPHLQLDLPAVGGVTLFCGPDRPGSVGQIADGEPAVEVGDRRTVAEEGFRRTVRRGQGDTNAGQRPAVLGIQYGATDGGRGNPQFDLPAGTDLDTLFIMRCRFSTGVSVRRRFPASDH